MTGLRFGVVGSGQLPDGLPDGPEAFRAIARAAEDEGYDSLWATDHVLSGHAILEGLVALSYFAGATRRIQLGASVYLLALRHPVVVAKQMATLDWLCGGRLALGVGLGGDHQAEFDAVGILRGERAARVDEGIACLRALWSGAPASHEGRFHAFRDVLLQPQPARPGGPPILVGGRVEAALARAGRLGDGWLASMCTPEGFARDWALVRARAEAAGRDPDALEPLALLPTHLDDDDARARAALGDHLARRYGRPCPAETVASACLAGTPERVRERVGDYLDAGVRHVVFSLAAAAPPVVARLARDVVAPLRRER